MKKEGKMMDQVTVRLPADQYELIEELARKERRKEAEVARLLLERGMAAFKIDGKLIADESGEVREPASQPMGSKKKA